MKTYPFILINKNNMKDLHHFNTAEQLGDHISGKRWNGFLVIVNEKTIINLATLYNVFEIREVERFLQAIEFEIY